jgi:molecular chaperone DnaK
LSEHGDKVDANERTNIENAIATLKEAVKTDDVESIQAKTQARAQASMKLGEAMYKASQAQGGDDTPPPGDDAAGSKPDDNVVDAEFSEVDDDKKKGAA